MNSKLPKDAGAPGFVLAVLLTVTFFWPSAAVAQDADRRAVIARLWGGENNFGSDALVEMLQSADRDERAYAAMSLGDESADSVSIDALISALGDDDEGVRLFAVASLVKIGEPAAPALAQALGQVLFPFEFTYHSEAANAVRSVGMGPAELAFTAIALSRYEHPEALLAAVPPLPRLFRGAPGQAVPSNDPIERAWTALLAQDEPSSRLVLAALRADLDETSPRPADGETYSQKERVTRAAFAAAGRVERPTQELISALRSGMLQPATRAPATCALVVLGLESAQSYPGCLRDPPLHDFTDPSFEHAVSVQLPDWFDDVAAARAFEDWTTNTPTGGLTYHMVARALTRARAARMADLLAPPSTMRVSRHEGRLPRFPWPPPPGFTDYVLPQELTRRAGSTLGEVSHTLTDALHEASGGRYTFGFFAGPADGFILLARMERINRDGSPLGGRARWLTDRASMSFIDVVSELFFERPGHFRVIAFAVTGDTTIETGATLTLPDPNDGRADLPSQTAREPMGQRRIHAIVYSFERARGGGIRLWTQGAPAAQRHIQAAGILSALRGQ